MQECIKKKKKKKDPTTLTQTPGYRGGIRTVNAMPKTASTLYKRKDYFPPDHSKEKGREKKFMSTRMSGGERISFEGSLITSQGKKKRGSSATNASPKEERGKKTFVSGSLSHQVWSGSPYYRLGGGGQ